MERLTQLEAEAASLQQSIETLREEAAARACSSLGEDYEMLRQAVLRYAIACAAVDVQVALMRARGDGCMASMSDLQKCTDEQTEASNVLRALGRRLQIESGAGAADPGRAAGYTGAMRAQTSR